MLRTGCAVRQKNRTADVKTDKAGAPINKIATRPFRSELLSFLLHSVEALYNAKTHSGRLWSAQNMPVAEANRRITKMLIRSVNDPTGRF